MVKKIEKSWFAIDGSLKEIDFDGENYFRSPEDLAEIVINSYTDKGDVVLNPFPGFGRKMAASPISIFFTSE